MSTLLNKFLRYVVIDTQSDPNSNTFPSTEKQKDLSRILLNELQQLNLESHMDDYGYVYAKLPSNTTKKGYKIGLIAHVDTSFDAPGANVNPRVIKNYDGSNIILNEEYQMDLIKFPVLNEVIGDDLVVTDGNTLLGADDKSGIAIIMQFIQEILNDKSFLHDDIYICFTPDEEIGRGVDHFNYDYFKVDFAYTLDGGQMGSIEMENFNAASAKVTTIGKSIHPGSAKDQLINAIKLATEFNSNLPKDEVPEHTEMYEGFYHLTSISGSVELATLEYIIRDHDMDSFKKRKELFETTKDKLNEKYGYEAFKVELKDQYYNMATYLEDKMYIVDLAKKAITDSGLEPVTLPIRGGTDGAMLTYNGLPCPNIGAGYYNAHGRYEFASVNQMEKTVEIVKRIIKIK